MKLKTIWKFPFAHGPIRLKTLCLPRGAKILSVQMRNGIPVLWAIVDFGEETREDYKIEMIATGEPFDPSKMEGLAFVDTFQRVDGSVWHLFADARLVGCTRYMPFSVSPGLLEFMNQHTNVTGPGPDCPPPFKTEPDKEQGPCGGG